MRWTTTLLSAGLLLAGCAGRAELGSQDLEPVDPPGTGVCPDNLKKLTELSIGVGIAVNEMRLEVAQGCAAIRQELGQSPPPVSDPVPAGQVLEQCSAAGEQLSAFGGIELSFLPTECLPSESGSLCLDDCDHPSCPAICDGVARAFGFCLTPEVTVSGYDDILAVHFRGPVEAISRSFWIAEVIADVYAPELAAIDPTALEEEVCVDLWLSLSDGLPAHAEGLEEVISSTTAVLAPVL